MQKKKQLSELEKLSDQVENYKENCQRMSKLKMTELIN